MRKKKNVYKLILFFFLAAQFQFLTLLNLPLLRVPGTQMSFDLNKLSLLKPHEIDSAGLSSGSATLTNPRLSFVGGVSGTIAAGSNVVTLNTSAATYGDIDTANLFNDDVVAVGLNGNIPVASISSSTVFTLQSPLVTAASNGNPVYGTQSGSLIVDFYTSAALPAGGSIRVEIPAPASNGNDGAPHTAATIAANGFDLNGITTSNVTCPPGLTAGTITPGTGGTPHMVSCNSASSIPAGAHFTVTIGNGVKGIINPGPINTGHTRGSADIYKISTYTKDGTNGAGNTVESMEMRTAPVEGVVVSATVDETLSFTVAGYAMSNNTRCGVTHTAGLTTTATAVPWGFLNSAYSADKNNAVQQLTVTTNAPTGYNVYAEENDQMGKEGNACVGTTPGADNYTFGSNVCIKDYTKGTASSTVYADWTATPGTDYGLGYSLENQSGTDARFTYNTSGGVFQAKRFADQEAGENKFATNADLMAGTGPRSGSSVYVCYRVHIPATQPAGFYYNKLKYTAVPKF